MIVLNILITNDDGVKAEGIAVLKKVLMQSGHSVTVAAPETEKSATGHAITLRRPIWVKEIEKDGGFFGYGVTGTPADSVKIGVLELASEKVDLVVSGINRGANLGTDIPYSGTVSGALEASIMGYPAVAISSIDPHDPYFETAAAFLVKYLKEFDIRTVPNLGALNINVPSIPYEELKGYKITRQSSRRFDDYYEKREDPYGNYYYWLMGNIKKEKLPEDNDWVAIEHDYVSISPLTIFMNDNRWYEELKKGR